jgi:hypothetical protein
VEDGKKREEKYRKKIVLKFCTDTNINTEISTHARTKRKTWLANVVI